MSELPDFLAPFTDTSTRNTSPEEFLPDTQVDFDALLYSQSNVIPYNLSLCDDPSSLFSAAVPSNSELGGSTQPPANQVPSFVSASYPSLNTMTHSIGGLSGRTDHHHSVITDAHSAHPKDMASSAAGHLMAEPADGEAANETRKRKRLPVPVDANTLICQWKGCRNKRFFNRREDLLRHVRTVHIFQGLHVCPVRGCYKRCNREDNLRNHINRCHGKTASVEVNSE